MAVLMILLLFLSACNGSDPPPPVQSKTINVAAQAEASAALRNAADALRGTEISSVVIDMNALDALRIDGADADMMAAINELVSAARTTGKHVQVKANQFSVYNRVNLPAQCAQ